MDGNAVREEIQALIKRGHYHSAQMLIEKHAAEDPVLADEFARWYLDRGDLCWSNGYEHYCRAYALMSSGLPESTRERMLRAFVKVGFHHHVRRLAEDLGRPLTRGEVVALVDRYTKGAVQSDGTEAELRDLAYRVGGDELESATAAELQAMHVRWERDGLLC